MVSSGCWWWTHHYSALTMFSPYQFIGPFGLNKGSDSIELGGKGMLQKRTLGRRRNMWRGIGVKSTLYNFSTRDNTNRGSPYGRIVNADVNFTQELCIQIILLTEKIGYSEIWKILLALSLYHRDYVYVENYLYWLSDLDQVAVSLLLSIFLLLLWLFSRRGLFISEFLWFRRSFISSISCCSFFACHKCL
jgi:hypothetical protein